MSSRQTDETNRATSVATSRILAFCACNAAKCKKKAFYISALVTGGPLRPALNAAATTAADDRGRSRRFADSLVVQRCV